MATDDLVPIRQIVWDTIEEVMLPAQEIKVNVSNESVTVTGTGLTSNAAARLQSNIVSALQGADYSYDSDSVVVD